MTQPTFEVGDRVRHRASGRVAIVTGVGWYCSKHRPLELCSLRIDRSQCQFLQSGLYDLSFDFGDDMDDVSGVLLEIAKD